LHAVIGFLDLLGASSLTDKQRDHIGGAQTSAKHLLALVSDVLDAAKIESGALDLDRAPFEPASTVHDAVTVVQNTAHAKGLRVGTVIGPELRASFLGDALRTRQILINLLGNAVKFARTRVEVRARWIGETDAFTIEIEDDGPGIHADQLARIFEPYRQADETTARTHGGTGLGLSIARDLARLMRGDITVRSEPAIGSTFCFSAPLLRAKASDVVPAIASPATDAGRLRILLADDDATNRLVGRELLGLLGHDVEVACDGAQAIERALATPFDLLVLDVEMPALDGTEVTRRLRSAGSDVPVLGFTGHASAEQRQACLRAGMNGVVQKPADLARLATGIASVVAHGVPARAASDRDLASALAHTVGLPTPAIAHERSAILQSARAKLLASHEPMRAGLAVKVPPPRPTSPDLRSGLDLGEATGRSSTTCSSPFARKRAACSASSRRRRRVETSRRCGASLTP
jgi:CheY-like chemotaxis protein